MCLKSKAIRVIVLWSFLVHIGLYFILRSGLTSVQYALPTGTILIYNGLYAFNYLLYPLGGLLGDIACRRYKIIKNSLMFLPFISVLLLVSGALILAFYRDVNPWRNEEGVIYMAVFGCLALLSIIGLIPFFANVVPFAMDQLRDSPAQDSSTFICWYVWTFCTASFLSLFIFNIVFYGTYGLSLDAASETSVIVGVTLILAIAISVLVIVVASLFVTGQRTEWFNIEPSNVNPYKLVYNVTRFACQHKIPICRSAFTYCEDEPPSRLDLGKSKYGGPFTTEEVEDVKVFYEIMKVLVSLGPFMYIFEDGADYFDGDVYLFAPRNFSRKIIHPHLLIAITLPIYLYFRKKKFRLLNCFPTLHTLRKLEIGMIIVLVKLLFMLLVDIGAHTIRTNLGCIFSEDSHDDIYSPSLLMFIIFTLEMLAALSVTVLYTSFLEFICAQSPQSMKGMLIGLTYALLLGFFGLLRVLLRTPFMFVFSDRFEVISCASVYYSINLVICLAAFITFVWVAKRYKYRQRDEPSRVRQYAEEYYSRQEPNGDFSTSL